MAGSVAHLTEFAGRYTNNLAIEISGLYREWDTQRQEKKNEWEELDRFLFATDTTTTSIAGLPWKNSTTLPKLCQIRDNLFANYFSSLFPNSKWLAWVGGSFEDVAIAKKRKIEAYMKTKIDQSDFYAEATKAVYSYIDRGNAIGFADYVDLGYTDEATGEWITTYIGPRLNHVDINDIVFNPIVRSFDDSPVILREIKTLGEIYALSEQPGNDHWKEYLAERNEMKRMVGSFNESDLEKAGLYIADGFGSYESYYCSEYVEILTFYGDRFDEETQELKVNQRIIVADRSYLVSSGTSPTWIGRKNFFKVGWRDRPHNLYSMGPLDNLVGLQYRIDHLENLKADAQDLIVQPPLKTQGEVEPFKWGPMERIHCPDGDVTPMTSDLSGIFNANNEIALLEQRMEEYAGAPKQAMGIRTPGEKTAYEVQQLENNAGRIFQEKITKFERFFLEPALNAMLEVARRNLNATDVAKAIDENGVSDFLKITKEDIKGKGNLRPMGARHFAEQAQTLQNLNMTLQGPLAEYVGPHLSRQKLARMIVESLNLGEAEVFSVNKGVMEDADTAKAQVAANQSVAESAMSPPPGADPNAPA